MAVEAADLRLKFFGDAVDRLLTVDVSARGIISMLYREARKRNNGRSLTMSAAEIFYERLRGETQRTAIIATGLPIRGWFDHTLAETDGPVGAATLARALVVGFGALPVVVCEETMVPLLEACCRAAGLVCTSIENMRRAASSPDAVKGRFIPTAVVIGFPADEKSAVKCAREIVADLEPAVLISSERQGANAKGVYHYGLGEANISSAMAKVERLFEEAQRKNIPTIGVGDGGNELGMGSIKDAVQEHVPYGKLCRCPCGDGMAPDLKVDLLVAATVSDWGMWGIEACLAALCGKPSVLHSSETLEMVLDACVASGAIDGVTAYVNRDIDGVSYETQMAMLRVLHEIVGAHAAPKRAGSR
ncbi:MAG: glutamate cyclase domain-containing protein [Vulcanimicrobiaceae bacterium]